MKSGQEGEEVAGDRGRSQEAQPVGGGWEGAVCERLQVGNTNAVEHAPQTHAAGHSPPPHTAHIYQSLLQITF